MTADWEKIKPIKINDNVILTYQGYQKSRGEIFTFKDYEILFSNDQLCCNWPGILLKKKRVINLDMDKLKKIDLGYINKVTLKYGEDFVKRNNSFESHREYQFVNKDTGKRHVTDNVFTLNFDNTKLSFFNGNNEDGYYNNDFIIYKNKKMIFKSSF